jgi:hypothetical protein
MLFYFGGTTTFFVDFISLNPTLLIKWITLPTIFAAVPFGVNGLARANKGGH